jgi:hypothetical protein
LLFEKTIYNEDGEPLNTRAFGKPSLAHELPAGLTRSLASADHNPVLFAQARGGDETRVTKVTKLEGAGHVGSDALAATIPSQGMQGKETIAPHRCPNRTFNALARADGR